MNSNLRVAFVHNRCRPYRHELLRRLDEEWATDFFFMTETNIGTPVCHEVLPGFFIPKFSGYEIVPGLLPALLRREAYDVYICTDVSYFITHVTFLVAQIKRRPFVLWNGGWLQVAHPRRYLMRPLENHIIRHSSAFVAYGSKAKEFLIERGADAERIYIAYNSVPVPPANVTVDDVALAKRELGLSGRRVVLFFGRLLSFKGIQYLVRAFAGVKNKCPDVALLIAGAGPEENGLRKLAAQLSTPDLVITGKAVGEREKALYLSMADLFVLPSVYHRSPEPWGLVLNEAAAFGKPLIATDMVGAAYDMIEDGQNGFIVPQRDPIALEQAIIGMMTDEVRLLAMGEASKRISKRFTIDQMFAAIRDALECAVAGNPGGEN